MEEIRKAAKAYYDNSSDEGRKEAKDWFRSMDKNGDGYISLQEFTMALSDNGDTNNTAFLGKLFNLLDQNRDGTLQFDEFITLVFLFSSRRPCCDGCGELILGLFFCCVECCLGRNGDADKTYDLCIPCYNGRHFVHEHADFIDNYSLLATMRNALASSASESNEDNPSRTAARHKNKSGAEEALDIADKFSKVVSIGQVLADLFL